jgi:hypothetical protein
VTQKTRGWGWAWRSKSGLKRRRSGRRYAASAVLVLKYLTVGTKRSELYKEGDAHNAARLLKKVLKADPGHVLATCRLALLNEFDLSDLQEAERLYRRAMTLAPDDVSLVYDFAVFQQERYIYRYICIYIYRYICIYMYYMYLYIYMCIYMYICMCICIYCVCIYVCVCVYMYMTLRSSSRSAVRTTTSPRRYMKRRWRWHQRTRLCST